jgi:hypothetical protein
MHDGDPEGPRQRGRLRDLGPVAAVVAAVALVVVAVMAPATRFTPSLLPEPSAGGPVGTAPEVAGVVVTRDTGAIVGWRAPVAGPVGVELIALAARPLSTPTGDAHGQATTSERGSTEIATLNSTVAAPPAPGAEPAAEPAEPASQPASDPLSATSTSGDRHPGRGKGADAASGRGKASTAGKPENTGKPASAGKSANAPSKQSAVPRSGPRR